MPEDRRENWIINTLLSRNPALIPGVLVGPGDDAAILDNGMVLTVDAMTEGIHWNDALSPADVGWKLAAVNASDLAACGALPCGSLLSLSLPSPLDTRWVTAFAQGLHEGLTHFGLPLLGGDTTGSPGPRFASLTAIGQLAGRPLLRVGARPGDDLWVSGTLGDAGAALQLNLVHDPIWQALARPSPPVSLGPALAGGLASAAMDLSDGLSQDLPRLCRASGVGAEVDPSLLPASSELLRHFPDPIPLQTAGGEDYQLLFTAAPALRAALIALGQELALRLTRIGQITSSLQVTLQGRTWPEGWRHFSGNFTDSADEKP